MDVKSQVSKPKYWFGTEPDDCNRCHNKLKKVFYDANSPLGWGMFCHSCFKSLGCKLGTGFGQKYNLQNDGKWLKTKG